jgi:sigma-B regulation protein RsbU (phosphoserine phosphatase)
MFVTLFYAEVDPTGALTYVNAGHNPAFLVRGSGECAELGPTGPVLGFDEATEYRQARAQLEPGDFVLLYTDGVTEAVWAENTDEFYGEDRLRAFLLSRGGQAPREILQGLIDALGDFIEPTGLRDDVTMVGIKRLA